MATQGPTAKPLKCAHHRFPNVMSTQKYSLVVISSFPLNFTLKPQRDYIDWMAMCLGLAVFCMIGKGIILMDGESKDSKIE